MTITEFILARVAEDEAVALHGDGGILFMEDAWFSKSRVLAECATKRRIVGCIERATGWHAPIEGLDPDDLLRLLALPYADHPDYRPEWKP